MMKIWKPEYEDYSYPARHDYWTGGTRHPEAENSSSASRAQRTDNARYLRVMGAGKKY
jgi:hypothetical protein